MKLTDVRDSVVIVAGAVTAILLPITAGLLTWLLIDQINFHNHLMKWEDEVKSKARPTALGKR